MALVRRHVYDSEDLSAGATAAADLRLAVRDLGESRPLRDFLKCNKAGRSAVGRALWRLGKAPGRAGADRLRPGRPAVAESVTCRYCRTTLAMFGVARPQETYRDQVSGLQLRDD